MKVSDILRSKGSQVITIHPQKTVKNAIHLLVKYNIGGLVVLDDLENIVGMITERDLIHFVANENPDFSLPVQEVMSTNILVGMPQDDLDSVGHTMTEKRFRHLPIVEGGKLVGIVSIGDVVKAQRDRYEGEIHNLMIQAYAPEKAAPV